MKWQKRSAGKAGKPGLERRWRTEVKRDELQRLQPEVATFTPAPLAKALREEL